MTIEFRCETCGRSLRTAEERAGQSARCPQCGTEVTVPEPVATESEVSEAGAAQRGATDEEATGGDGQKGEGQNRSDSATEVVKSASPLGDFAAMTQAAPPSMLEPVEVTCPMCGAVNDNTTDRCRNCGERLEQRATQSLGGLSMAFGDIWSRAWDLWKDNLGVHIASVAIVGAVLVLLGLIVGVVGTVLGAAYGYSQVASSPVQPQPADLAENISEMSLAFQLVTRLVSYIIASFFLFGLSRLALETVRRRNPRLGAMWPPPAILGTVIGGMFLYGIVRFAVSIPAFALSTFGLQRIEAGHPEFFLIVPFAGLVNVAVIGIVTIFFWPAPYLLVDRPLGPFRSLLAALPIAVRYFPLSILLALVVGGLNLAGTLACFVGLLFSIPLSFVLLAVAFERDRLRSLETQPSREGDGE